MATYNSPADPSATSLAKSSDINNVDAAVAAAFALLPTNANINAGAVNFAVDTGAANAYLAALPMTAVSYTDGLQVVMRPLNANTGACTVNVDSLGVKAIKTQANTDLPAGSITAGIPITLRYSSITGFFHTWVSSSLVPVVLPDGTTATTQAAGSNDSKVATNAYVDNVAAGILAGTEAIAGTSLQKFMIYTGTHNIGFYAVGADELDARNNALDNIIFGAKDLKAYGDSLGAPGEVWYFGATGYPSRVQSLATASRTVYIPDAAGTIALTSDLASYLTKQLAENTPLLLDSALSADGKYSATEAEAGILGETVAFGEAVYFKAADSRWWKTDATVTATSGAVRVGICVVAGDAAGATTIVFRGTVRADSLFDTFTVSAPVFLSAATAGKVTQTAPTGTTNFVVRIVGHAIDGNSIHVNVSNDYVELA